MSQVAGRAGRREEKGLVLIQTSNPEHPIFDKIINNDFLSMVDGELKERKKFNYPPFSRIIEIIFKHKDKERALQIADIFALEIKRVLSVDMILGPEEPLISKIRNEYLQHILIKVERGKTNLSYVKEYLGKTAMITQSKKEFRSGKIVFNVDPN
jgi:primosomal protein N' (replication factor Y)